MTSISSSFNSLWKCFGGILSSSSADNRMRRTTSDSSDSSRDDHAGVDRVVKNVESQVGLTSLFVRTMTGKALVGQNRAHLLHKRNRRGHRLAHLVGSMEKSCKRDR